MILHYLKVAVRNLLKYRTQSVISIMGLAVGFACFALAAIWIKYEFTYDSFHEDAGQICVVRIEDKNEANGLSKVNGASMKDLYKLLFRKYIIVLGIAFVVGTPIAYYLMQQYTADFVVKTPMGIGIFIIALLIVTLISLGTLFWQVRKAANINPADVVKRE